MMAYPKLGFNHMGRGRSLAPWLLVGVLTTGCSPQTGSQPPALAATPVQGVGLTRDGVRPVPLPPGLVQTPPPTMETLAQESWVAYRQRFIQGDGRVIDWESNGRTVSEGQAYALLRAVMLDDPETFALTLQWAENNLRRSQQNIQPDSLWAWKWGQRPDGSWGIIDPNFASDADIDAATALILAARRWQRPEYLELARTKLADLWLHSTLALPAQNPAESHRYLLPGPLPAFQPQPGVIYLNPSYLAPYAFRLFAQVDPERDWLALVESSYAILEQTRPLSPAGLPSDWVVLDLASRTLQPSTHPTLLSRYGFDAYRVWWRVALDAAWFGEPRADRFLQAHLPTLTQRWQTQQAIPAILDRQGNPLVDYASTAQYAMLYPAFERVNPEIAAALFSQKLQPTYHLGIWDNANAYYTQNLAWLGLFSIPSIAPEWLQKPQ